MNPLAIFKPEYLYRPDVIFKRIFSNVPKTDGHVVLPWGLPLKVNCDELIGRRIWANGVFELAVSEVVWRLTANGDYCIDAGANIGYITSIMAFRAGPKGTVYAFEPHPKVFKDLQNNVSSWEKYKIANIRLSKSALSAFCGNMKLAVPESFEENHGLSSLSGNHSTNSIPVRVETIDSILGPHESVDLLKIDVEGHEASVIMGSTGAIERRGVRDIVFEDHHPYPSEASKFLLKSGYKVFRIEYSWFGPALKNPTQPRCSFRIDDTPNYLATLDPERTLSKMRGIGWHCLMPKIIAKR